MAAILEAKVPTEVVRRVFTVPVDDDDAPGSVAVSASGVTVDASSFEGDDIVLTLSGGTAAATGSITVTITTNKGRVLVETLYIPIIASEAQTAATAREYIDFALRKVVGVGATATASELDDALDRLNAMIAEWRVGGADIAAPYPLTANTVIYCPDYAVGAIRYNLLMDCADMYGVPVSAMDAMRARQGLQLIKHKNLPDERKVEYY